MSNPEMLLVSRMNRSKADFTQCIDALTDCESLLDRKISISRREAKRHHSVTGGCPQLDVQWLLLGHKKHRGKT